LKEERGKPRIRGGKNPEIWLKEGKRGSIPPWDAKKGTAPCRPEKNTFLPPARTVTPRAGKKKKKKGYLSHRECRQSLGTKRKKKKKGKEARLFFQGEKKRKKLCASSWCPVDTKEGAKMLKRGEKGKRKKKKGVVTMPPAPERQEKKKSPSKASWKKKNDPLPCPPPQARCARPAYNKGHQKKKNHKANKKKKKTPRKKTPPATGSP